MYQRTKILEAFATAGLTKSRKTKVKQFLQYLSDNPKVCWKDAASDFHNNYSDIFDDVVPVILSTNDPLIISNLLKYLNLKKDKEVKSVKAYIKKSDAFQQSRLFMHIAKYYVAELGDDLLQKNKLPKKIRAVINIRSRKKSSSVNEQKKGNIEIFTGKDKQYYFHVISDEGGILLVSEGYKAKASCQNGIKSVQQNAVDENKYQRKISKDNQHYFVLVAKNKKVIGNSIMYESDTLRDKAIKTVQQMVNNANVVPLDKQTG